MAYPELSDHPKIVGLFSLKGLILKISIFSIKKSISSLALSNNGEKSDLIFESHSKELKFRIFIKV